MPARNPVADRVRHLPMLSRPVLRAACLLLTVVRRIDGREQFGLLYDARGCRPAGFPAMACLANLFALSPTEAELLALPRETTDSPRRSSPKNGASNEPHPEGGDCP